MIRIQVPATSANLGSGFDALGIALSLHNQVWMEESDKVEISCKDNIVVPTDERNLIFSTARTLYEACGKSLKGLKIIQQNDIPMARGLGSSSACIVAGLMGANHLLGNPLTQEELVSLGTKIEGHPDNVAPALEGGLVASAMENGEVYSVSVPVSEKIRFAVFIPPFELKTEEARAVLPQQYSRSDAVYNISRSALMAASLFSGKLENLKVAVQDKIHQPYRKGLISNIDNVFAMGEEFGSLGTYISGAGPTIISFVTEESSERFISCAKARMCEKGMEGWQLKLLNTSAEGALVFAE